MELPTVLRELLLILITFGLAVGKEQYEEDFPPSEKQPYRSDYVPTYSRHTPFMEENEFPEPVFGVAHWLPYEELNKSREKDDSQNNSSESSRQQDEELLEPEEMEGDLPEALGEVQQSIDEYIPRKLRKTAKSFVRLPQAEYAESTDSGESFAPAYRSQPWRGRLKERGPFAEEPQTPEQRYASEEETIPRQKKPQRVNFAEDYEEQKRRPSHQRFRRPYSQNPNGRTSSGNGHGTESVRMGGRRSRDSGEQTETKGHFSGRTTDGQKGEKPRGAGGKLVGVDMQMVAGVYPQKTENRSHGRKDLERYSPLSGPFPGHDDEDEESVELIGSKNRRGKDRAVSPYRKAGIPSRTESEVKDNRGSKHGTRDAPYKNHGDNCQREDDKGLAPVSHKGWQQSDTREKSAVRPAPEKMIRMNSEEFPVPSRDLVPESRYSAPNRETETYQTSSVPTVILKKNEYNRQLQEVKKGDASEERIHQSPGLDLKYTTQELQSTYARRPLAYGNESGQQIIPRTDNNESANTPIPPRTPSSSLPLAPKESLPTPSYNFRDLRQDERVDFGAGARTPDPAPYDENVTTTSSPANSTWTYATTQVVVSSTLLINTDRPI